jgi:hypothetical protein
LFKSFQIKLILFFVALIAVVQLVTYFAVYNATNHNVSTQIKSQLVHASGSFQKHLDEQAARLTEGAVILVSDYAFREAIVTGDRATSLSAIRNLAARIEADRAMLISLDKRVTADTHHPAGDEYSFPLARMIEQAEDKDKSVSTVILDDKLYEFVVVPVLAPIPVAWIGMGIEIDNAVVSDMTSLSPLPLDISLLERGIGN